MKALIISLTSLLLVVASSVNLAHAQSRLANSAYVELGGNGLFSSLNYERQLTRTPGLQLRVGIGFYTEKTLYLSTPVGLTYLINLKNERSFIDIGVGATWAQANSHIFSLESTSRGESFLSYVPSIGYRRYTRTNFMWRLNITPVINQYGVVPWAGLSLGKRF